MRPVSKGPSVNVARQRLPEVTEEATDIVRPIGDVRSFQHQVTKGRYDRWELYCVAWVSCEARARVTSQRFDSYQMMKATLRADKKNMLIERILLCPGHTLLHWDVNCFLLIFLCTYFTIFFSEFRDPKSAIKQEASTMNGGPVRRPSLPVILFLTILMTVSRHLM